jgi:hypothetical protein
MSRYAKIIRWVLAWLSALGVVTVLLHDPASAITAELAKKCRTMAIKAHPPAPAGTKTHAAQAERDFFRACIANSGATQDNDTEKTTAPAAK